MQKSKIELEVMLVNGNGLMTRDIHLGQTYKVIEEPQFHYSGKKLKINAILKRM